VEVTGLVRRRRRGPASVELPGRSWRGGGGGRILGGGGRGRRRGGSEPVEAVDLAEDWSAFGALALRAG
jgi:hypothetical protein